MRKPRRDTDSQDVLEDQLMKRLADVASTGAIFTTSELASRWRVSRHTVVSAIRAGRLQAFKVGARSYRVREAEVLRYEQQGLAVAS